MLLPMRDMQAHRLAAPALPGWVMPLFGDAHGASMDDMPGGEAMLVQSSDSWTLAAIKLTDAAHVSASQLRQSVAEAYLQLLEILPVHEGHKPVRFWNYVPRILDEAEPGRNRYMMFNQGRHEAFVRWLDGEPMGASLVAASAVDHGGDDLHIHMLACRAGCRSIENPRQRPAYQYSQRYGPVPPSFARATLIDPVQAGDPTRLITAGTASVLGEDSHHQNNVQLQLEETLTNLAVLIAQALPDSHKLMRSMEHDSAIRRDLLARARHVRAYVTRAGDHAVVSRMLSEVMRQNQMIELMPAVLCRKDLLVEIEILAAIDHETAGDNSNRQRP